MTIELYNIILCHDNKTYKMFYTSNQCVLNCERVIGNVVIPLLYPQFIQNLYIINPKWLKISIF